MQDIYQLWNLESRFIEIDEKNDDKILVRAKICQIKKQMDLKSTEIAEKEYLSQTSYIILARIILTKCWEDLGLIDPPNTYNGGFKKYIQEYNEKNWIQEYNEKNWVKF
ncbi:hypothetical protein LCGC14_1743370 [marine sediment metagenome]|uniref:Uncharacterized protein n=1 Tax=marine sediment metagenome TaxID=412755 RepID=A0A0F9K5M5_9ZZZZ